MWTVNNFCLLSWGAQIVKLCGLNKKYDRNKNLFISSEVTGLAMWLIITDSD